MPSEIKPLDVSMIYLFKKNCAVRRTAVISPVGTSTPISTIACNTLHGSINLSQGTNRCTSLKLSKVTKLKGLPKNKSGSFSLCQDLSHTPHKMPQATLPLCLD